MIENVVKLNYNKKKKDKKMIDLNNTWCLNTEENYNALLKYRVKTHFNFNKEYEYLSVNSHGDMWACKVYGKKQIHLINGEFQYVETKPKNNFKDYGFEADFEGEILKEYDDCYIGSILNHINKNHMEGKWDKKGYSKHSNKWNLKPIKKEWYENADNFPCLIVRDYDYLDVAKGVLDDGRINLGCIAISKDKCRPATKEEVLALLVKE